MYYDLEKNVVLRISLLSAWGSEFFDDQLE